MGQKAAGSKCTPESANAASCLSILSCIDYRSWIAVLLYLHLKDGVIGFYRRNKLGMASCQFPGWGGGIDHGMATLENRPNKCKERRYHPDILMLQNIRSNFGTEGHLTDFAQVSWVFFLSEVSLMALCGWQKIICRCPLLIARSVFSDHRCSRLYFLNSPSPV